MKRKHNSCTVQQKLEVLQRLDKGESVTKLASELGVGRATICDWKKNREKIEKFCEMSFGSTQERFTSKLSKYEKLDEVLFLWFFQERKKGTPLSGPLIREKALQLNTKLGGDPSFIASSGWLDRWKKRHGIQLSITSEKLSADTAASDNFVRKFAEFIASKNLSPQQVYNCDVTGLYFKSLPTKKLDSKEESYPPGFKMSKECVTVFTCCNASGNHKLPLMVIGESKRTQAFKNVNMNTLPVFYRHHKKAWMDFDLFIEWFKNQFVSAVASFNKNNGLPNRALLIVDNTSSHSSGGELSCGEIKVLFLSPNNAFIQTMDQGVPQIIKFGYKKLLLQFLIDTQSESLSILQKLKTVSVKDVVYWVAEVWDNVTEKTLQETWPGITSISCTKSIKSASNEILSLLKKIPGCERAEKNDVEEWMSRSEVNFQLFFTNDDPSVKKEPPGDTSSSDESDSDIPTPVSHSEAVTAFETALRYVEQNDDATPADINFLRRWLQTASSSRNSSLSQANNSLFPK